MSKAVEMFLIKILHSHAAEGIYICIHTCIHCVYTVYIYIHTGNPNHGFEFLTNFY